MPDPTHETLTVPRLNAVRQLLQTPGGAGATGLPADVSETILDLLTAYNELAPARLDLSVRRLTCLTVTCATPTCSSQLVDDDERELHWTNLEQAREYIAVVNRDYDEPYDQWRVNPDGSFTCGACVTHEECTRAGWHQWTGWRECLCGGTDPRHAAAGGSPQYRSCGYCRVPDVPGPAKPCRPEPAVPAAP